MEARSAKRRRQVDLLYELWDVNTSGYLELEEIQVVLNKWRSDGIENFKEGIAMTDSAKKLCLKFQQM